MFEGGGDGGVGLREGGMVRVDWLAGWVSGRRGDKLGCECREVSMEFKIEESEISIDSFRQATLSRS
jgi:hypothetical protein